MYLTCVLTGAGTFDCGFETHGRNWLEISGTRGKIDVNDFSNGGAFTAGNYYTVHGGAEYVLNTVFHLSDLSRVAFVEIF